MLHGGHLLSVLIFFPAIGALALMMLRGDDHKFIRAIAMVVSVAEFIFSLLLLRYVPIGASGYQLEEFAKWIPAPPIHYHLGHAPRSHRPPRAFLAVLPEAGSRSVIQGLARSMSKGSM